MRITIIGGGIGGLATALALHRLGHSPRVYERAPEFREVGAGISLWPNATRVLDSLGVLDEALESSSIVREVHIRTNGGESISIARHAAYSTPCIGIHRAVLLELLRKQLPSNQLFTGHELVDLVQSADGMRATFANGQIDVCDLLIGADGLRSRVRQTVIGDGDPVYRGYWVWRGLVNFELPGYPPGMVSETWHRGYRFGIFPLGRGEVYWYSTANLAHDTTLPTGDKKFLTRAFGTFHEPIGSLIAATDEKLILKSLCYDREPRRGWSRENAVLIGDAAHPTTPNLGQGGCMALEDAATLATLIAQHRGDLHSTLLHFEELRFARTSKVTRMSRFFGGLGQMQGMIASTLVNTMLRLSSDSMAERTFRSLYSYQTPVLEARL